MPKVVINKCYGGFGLSAEATVAYYKRKGITCYVFDRLYEGNKERYAEVTNKSRFFTAFNVPNPNDYSSKELWGDKHYLGEPEDRCDPDLIAVVEEFGERANGPCAKLVIVNVPDGVNWDIDEYDGIEHVEERHRRWG